MGHGDGMEDIDLSAVESGGVTGPVGVTNEVRGALKTGTRGIRCSRTAPNCRLWDSTLEHTAPPSPSESFVGAKARTSEGRRGRSGWVSAMLCSTG